MNFDSFTDLCLEIENTQVKNLKWEDRRETKLYKLMMFSFDFFFVVKGIRLCVWRIEYLNIGGNNNKCPVCKHRFSGQIY